MPLLFAFRLKTVVFRRACTSAHRCFNLTSSSVILWIALKVQLNLSQAAHGVVVIAVNSIRAWLRGWELAVPYKQFEGEEQREVLVECSR
jgi:hypothetical protein